MNFVKNIVDIGSSFIHGLSGGNTSNPRTDSESHDRHVPSELDVQSVRLHLRNYLPLELVDTIIEDAQYWPCIHIATREEIRAEASRYRTQSAEWCYLLSPPIPGSVNQNGEDTIDGERRRKVRKVQFEIESNDQGWGGEPDDRGTFNGSWTWFEACIIRTSYENMPSWLQAAYERPIDLGGLSLHRPSVRDFWNSVLVGPSSKRWLIQSNKTATSTKQSHSVLWTDEGDGNALYEEEPFKGRRGPERGHELVRLLQPGDRVAILAKAQFPGWANTIYTASISIYYSV